MRRRVGVLVAVGGLAGGLVAGCGGAPPPNPPRKHWAPRLEQLIPADVDVVAKVDWARARRAGVQDTAEAMLRESGLSPAVLDAIEGCLPEADTLRLAIRLGPEGLDGDVLAVVTGLPKLQRGIPCGAKGWKHSGKRRDLDVYEPEIPSSDRSAGAMMLRSERGAVAVVTPGQVDAVLRLLRDGPDGDRLDPKGDAVLVLDARVNDTMLPEVWRAQARSLTELAYGLSMANVRVQVRDGIRVRAALTYVDRSAANEAGEKLREVRKALIGSKRAVFVQAAKSAHASVQGELLRVELTIPDPAAKTDEAGTPVQ